MAREDWVTASDYGFYTYAGRSSETIRVRVNRSEYEMLEAVIHQRRYENLQTIGDAVRDAIHRWLKEFGREESIPQHNNVLRLLEIEDSHVHEERLALMAKEQINNLAEFVRDCTAAGLPERAAAIVQDFAQKVAQLPDQYWRQRLLQDIFRRFPEVFPQQATVQIAAATNGVQP